MASHVTAMACVVTAGNEEEENAIYRETKICLYIRGRPANEKRLKLY